MKTHELQARPEKVYCHADVLSAVSIYFITDPGVRVLWTHEGKLLSQVDGLSD